MGGEPVERDVELLSLNSPSVPCSKPPDYPHTIFSATGGYVDDKVLVCGGFDDFYFETTTKCFEYDISKERWSRGPDMTEARLRPASACSKP